MSQAMVCQWVSGGCTEVRVSLLCEPNFLCFGSSVLQVFLTMLSVKFLFYFIFQEAFSHVVRGSYSALNIACCVYVEVLTYPYVFMVDDVKTSSFLCSFLFVNFFNT